MKRIKTFCLEILPTVRDSLPQRNLRMRAHVERSDGSRRHTSLPILVVVIPYLCMAGETSHSLCERQNFATTRGSGSGKSTRVTALARWPNPYGDEVVRWQKSTGHLFSANPPPYAVTQIRHRQRIRLCAAATSSPLR